MHAFMYGIVCLYTCMYVSMDAFMCNVNVVCTFAYAIHTNIHTGTHIRKKLPHHIHHSSRSMQTCMCVCMFTGICECISIMKISLFLFQRVWMYAHVFACRNWKQCPELHWNSKPKFEHDCTKIWARLYQNLSTIVPKFKVEHDCTKIWARLYKNSKLSTIVSKFKVEHDCTKIWARLYLCPIFLSKFRLFGQWIFEFQIQNFRCFLSNFALFDNCLFEFQIQIRVRNLDARFHTGFEIQSSSPNTKSKKNQNLKTRFHIVGGSYFEFKIEVRFEIWNLKIKIWKLGST